MDFFIRYTLLLLLLLSPNLAFGYVKKSISIIFCDLTSVPASEGQRISGFAAKAARIALSIPSGSRVYVFPIDSTTETAPIDYFQKKFARKPSQKRMCDLWNKNRAKLLYKKIIYLYETVYMHEEVQVRSLSCLIKTLSAAHDFFSLFKMSQKYSDYSYDIYYLSDMMEECEGASYGNVSFRNDRKSTIKRLNDYSPGFDLSYANVKVVLTSKAPATSNNQYISRERLREEWKKIFMKVGFTEKQIQTFGFNVIPVLNDG